MGKKRKAGGQPAAQLSSQEYNRGDSKLDIRSYEDVADSEDEFHINRDKILLAEEPAQKKQRMRREEDAFMELSDEEVLPELDDMSEMDVEQESDYAEDYQGFSDKERKSSTKRQNASDSEEAGEEEAAEGWGESKRDYYNADAIETEADALDEEKEALRLQMKQLQSMAEADYGFDETEWLDSGKADGKEEDQDTVVQDILPDVKITDSMTPEERSKILAVRYPEFELLAQELLSLQPQHEDLILAESAAQAVNHQAANGVMNKEPIISLKCRALGGYLAGLSMYFAVLTSGAKSLDGQKKAKPPAELRDHPVMETLIQYKSLWDKVKDVPIPDAAELVNSNEPTDMNGTLPLGGKAIDRSDMGNSKQDKPKKKRRSKAERAAAKALAEAEAHRAERARRIEESIANLSTLPSSIATKPNKSQAPDSMEEDDSDFGEETALTAEEAAEKAKRKKGLRFYTSQIAQKANKRGTAGRDAGGDEDIPHRERLKDRQARLNTLAENRGKKKGQEISDVLGGDSDNDDMEASRAIRDRGDEEYYDFIAVRTKEKKDAKAARGAAHREAAAIGAQVREVEEVGPDGKRAITYAIERNKGLTPKRSKDVRNPRVKKRKKYEEKKKKLGSIRQVYKGGEGRGGYGGELTGIKTNLVKSVKL